MSIARSNVIVKSKKLQREGTLSGPTCAATQKSRYAMPCP